MKELQINIEQMHGLEQPPQNIKRKLPYDEEIRP